MFSLKTLGKPTLSIDGLIAISYITRPVSYSLLTQRLVVVFRHEVLGLFCAGELHEAVVVLALARDRDVGP